MPISRFVEMPGLVAGVVEDLLVERIRDVERADDGERVDPRLAPLAEDFGDDALAFQVGRGVADHLDGDLVARLDALGAGVADVDRVVERRAVDPDEAGAALLEVGADEDSRRSREDLDDAAFDVHPRPPGSLGDLDGHLIAAGGVAAGVGRDVDLVRSVASGVGADEPEAPGRAAEDADDHPRPVGLAQGLVLAQVELLLLDEPLDRLAELGVVVGGDLEPPRHRLERDRLVIGLGDQLQDAFGEFRHRGDLRTDHG